MLIFDSQLIEQRLREQGVVEQVLTAADYASVKSLADFRPGSAFVFLISEKNPVEGNQPRMRAAAMATIGVVLAVRNYRDTRGAAALADLQQQVGAVRQSLLGWCPPGCTALAWQQGEVMDYDRSNLLWLDIYTTTHVLGGSTP